MDRVNWGVSVDRVVLTVSIDFVLLAFILDLGGLLCFSGH